MNTFEKKYLEGVPLKSVDSCTEGELSLLKKLDKAQKFCAERSYGGRAKTEMANDEYF